MRLTSVVIAFSLMATPACAQIWNGNELYDMCKDGRNTLNGYVAGVFDKGVSDIVFADHWAPTVESKEGLKKVIKPYCIPDRVRVSQMRDVVCKFLADRPNQRHLPGAPLVQTALAEAFPCK